MPSAAASQDAQVYERSEWLTSDGEAKRDDQNFAHAAVWEFTGVGNAPKRHKEELVFENVHLATRSYK